MTNDEASSFLLSLPAASVPSKAGSGGVTAETSPARAAAAVNSSLVVSLAANSFNKGLPLSLVDVMVMRIERKGYCRCVFSFTVIEFFELRSIELWLKNKRATRHVSSQGWSPNKALSQSVILKNQRPCDSNCRLTFFVIFFLSFLHYMYGRIPTRTRESLNALKLDSFAMPILQHNPQGLRATLATSLASKWTSSELGLLVRVSKNVERSSARRPKAQRGSSLLIVPFWFGMTAGRDWAKMSSVGVYTSRTWNRILCRC